MAMMDGLAADAALQGLLLQMDSKGANRLKPCRTPPRAIPEGKNVGGARRVKEARRNEEFLDAHSEP